MATRLLLLALAGAFGTLARYGLTVLVKTHFGGALPWGTWAVNTIGCFFFGLVWAMSENAPAFSQETRLVLLVGCMGAFTTFSTYIFESATFFAAGMYGAMALNFIGQNLLGFAAFLGGVAVLRQFA